MKIAVIGSLELPQAQGGVSRHCEEIYARVAADGHDVTVLCADGPARVVSYRGMRIRKLRTARSKGWERLTYAIAASIAATRGDFDVVHYHSFASSALCALPKLRGRKVVTTAHRIEWQDAKWSTITRWFLRYCEWAALRFSDAIITVSQALKDDLSTRNRRAAHATVVSNGVTPREAAGIGALDEFDLRAGGYLLIVGRLVPEKGVDVAISAYLDLLEPGDLPVDLVVVGGTRHGASATELALRAQAGPARERIRFLGIQSPEVVAALYDQARALVAPSYQEGQPLVVAEAMAAGCCVVASDIPAHVELCADAAVTFRCGDPTALAEAITWVLAHPTDAQALGTRARMRIAEGGYSWDHAAAATERVLASLFGASL